MSEQAAENDAPETNWFREVYERARARNAMIPEHARPRFNLRAAPIPRGCHCGHPGAGCTCVIPPAMPGEPS